MIRRHAPSLLALLLVIGCAGPSKLAERSEDKLAGGDHWRAWELATHALDKAPGNARARAAAAAAAGSIAQDWQRRIHALAELDTVAAADQVLEFVGFRASAVPYTTVSLSPEWTNEEQILRRGAARIHYKDGAAAMDSRRPKKAWIHFTEAERHVAGYRDAGRLAERAYEKALARVAFVPFRSSPGSHSLGQEVAATWRDGVSQHLAPPVARFTKVTGAEANEQQMSVTMLERVSREEAVRLGRKAGVDRVVWGSIGGVDSDTRLHVFTDVIARRIVEKNSEGQSVTRWVDVPIEVISRVRTVTVPVEYEVIATKGAATLARQRVERATSARVVWTSYVPEGELDAYALVSDVVRAANPDRAKQVETRWKSACGEKTTLRQVLEARRSTRGSAHYRRDVLTRLIAGAAFVFLEDLPPANDLAFAALSGGWGPLHEDLLRLDAVDDVDLGVAMVPAGR